MNAHVGKGPITWSGHAQWRWCSGGLIGLLTVCLVFGGACATSQPPTSGAGASSLASESGPTLPAPAAGSGEAAAVTRAMSSAAAVVDMPMSGFELTLRFDDPRWGAMPVAVSVPARSAPSDRLPVLIAFHGRGESKKGPERGVRGWFDDYQLGAALQRVTQPPLTREDFHGFVAPERLAAINARLEQRAFTPFIIATPYLPDVLKGPEAFDNAGPLAEFVTQKLLPELRRRTPASSSPSHVGIDGVSLGGRAALLVAFTAPAEFGAVQALQPAVDERELDALATLAQRAALVNPDLELRLVTSWGDYYLDVTKQLHRRLIKAGVSNDLFVAHGTHSYQFNQGPGCYEMLLFHDEALRR